jgi:hypothetical protein
LRPFKGAEHGVLLARVPLNETAVVLGMGDVVGKDNDLPLSLVWQERRQVQPAL